MAEGRERPNAITHDLGRRQNCRRKNRAGDAPQPKPEHERQNDENRIERKSLREKEWRHRLAFDHMNGAVERRREQGLPSRSDRDPNIPR